MAIRRGIEWNRDHCWLLHLPDHWALPKAQKGMKFQNTRVNFAELTVGGNTPLHRLDSRVKIVFVVMLLFGIAALLHPTIPIIIFILFTLTSLVIGISPIILLKRLVAPFSIAIVVLVVVTFTYGGNDEIWSFRGFPVYSESLSFALLLCTRLMASISVLNLFIMVTSITDAIETLRWFKVPNVVVDLAAMMLRYIQLLSKESVRMNQAKESRCGFSDRLGYVKRIQNLGETGGALILRAFNRSERVYMAMISRGYIINSTIVRCKPLTLENALLCIGTIFMVLSLVYIDRVMI